MAGTRGYAVCGERRSGSNFLSSVLASTGVLGKPAEYFSTPAMRTRMPDYPDDPDEQVRRVPTLAATPNGVYGLKLHAIEFDRIERTRWVERLPGLSFVYLERRDILGQAISWVRAAQTDQWISGIAAKAAPVYDRTTINQALVALLSNQNRWRYYLARNGIAYLHLVYEDVVRAPQEAAEAVGRLVDLDVAPRVDLAKVPLDMQRDALNAEWRARFIADSGDLGRFD